MSACCSICPIDVDAWSTHHFTISFRYPSSITKALSRSKQLCNILRTYNRYQRTLSLVFASRPVLHLSRLIGKREEDGSCASSIISPLTPPAQAHPRLRCCRCGMVRCPLRSDRDLRSDGAISILHIIPLFKWGDEVTWAIFSSGPVPRTINLSSEGAKICCPL